MPTYYDGGEALLEESINHIDNIHSSLSNVLPESHPALAHSTTAHEFGTAAWREHTLKGNMVGASMFLEDGVRAARTAVAMFGQSRQAVTNSFSHLDAHKSLAQLVIAHAKYNQMMGL